MIVAMKQVSLLVLDKYKEESLFALRRLGLLHVKYTKPPCSRDIDSLEAKITDTQRALLVISKYSPDTRQDEEINEQAVFSCVRQIVALGTEKEDHLRNKQDIEGKISWYKTWGEFSLNSLKELAENSVYIRFYKCNKRELEVLRETKMVEVIKKEAAVYYISVVSYADKQDVNLQEIIPPGYDLKVFRNELLETENKISSIDNLLRKKATYKKSLSDYLKQLRRLLDFNKVQSSMQEEEGISYLQGFMPAGEVDRVVDLAGRKGWAYLIHEPENPQEVPSFIKNPRWLRIIEPVFKFMGTLPGYNEYDISFSFLVFFSIFFAMIIGDAGYGLLFLVITYLLRKRMPRLPSQPFILVYILSFATIIWGAISGTWFGFEPIAHLPLIRNLIVPQFYSFTDSNQHFLMYVCFLIGAAHLTIAHVICALRYMNSLFALSQLGWICIVWGIFCLAGTLVLDNPFPLFARYLLMIGIGLIALFSNPQRNMFKGILISLVNLPFKLIGVFGDTLSYLRLFAVGTASVMVAASFNAMALAMGFNSLITSLGAAVILLGGHLLNIVLGLLSVLVHGIRLNMLEFSGHLGMQWSGIEYKPFKE